MQVSLTLAPTPTPEQVTAVYARYEAEMHRLFRAHAARPAPSNPLTLTLTLTSTLALTLPLTLTLTP